MDDQQVDASVSKFNAWLGEHNNDEWSYTRMTDAQKESLLWVGICVIISVCFWKGIPWHSRVVECYDKDKLGRYIKIDGVRQTKRVVLLRWIPVLAPLKYLTVLYHECCHAIVGFCTGGRPVCIIVDWNEGGATLFDKGRKQPNPTFTLPAGYVGSCFIGCGFLFCGFDTVASKWAFVAFECMALLSILICLAVLPKSSLYHWRHMIAHYWFKLLGNHGRSKEKKEQHDASETQHLRESRWKGKKQADAMTSDKAQMVSIEIIILTDMIIGGIVALAWFLNDSLYLRFVILFLGTTNTLYAIWDVYLNGVKYGKVFASDCTDMARRFNRYREKRGMKPMKVSDYAAIWLSIQTCLFVATVMLALWFWRDTIAEQAFRSRRSILATSHHYTPANLLQNAQDTAKGWFQEDDDGAN